MKISVSGKGGSGKSTVTTLLAAAFRRKGFRPLIVDADESNSVLYRMLGMANPPQPLVALAGGRQMVKQLMPPGYRPGAPGEGTNVLTQASISPDEIPAANIAENNGIRLIVIGKIAESLEGCACPMGVLGREFLGKLKLEKEEVVLVDMEAGIEHFGRGVEASLDSVVAVVEPSFESLSLAERIMKLSLGIGIRKFGTVLNKVNSQAVYRKMEAELSSRGVVLLGSVPYDEEVFNACLDGRKIPEGNANITGSLDRIVAALLQS